MEANKNESGRTWQKINKIMADYQKREARARSIAARNREMPKMCELLGMEYKPMNKTTEQHT